jgi:hypothetical protein
MGKESRSILCSATSMRRRWRLIDVKIALQKRDPSRESSLCGSISMDLLRAGPSVSGFLIRSIPRRMSVRLYALQKSSWPESVCLSVTPKTFTDLAFQYLSTAVAPFYMNLLSTPE